MTNTISMADFQSQSAIDSQLQARVSELQTIVSELSEVEASLNAAKSELDTCKKLLSLRSKAPQEVLEPVEDTSMATPESSPTQEEIKDPSRLIFDRISLDGDSEFFDYSS